MSRRPRRSLHFACMIVIFLLYVVSVPWYRESDAPLRIWLGLPDWVAVALVCYVAVAILNAVAWSVSDMSDADEAPPAPEGPTSDGPSQSDAVPALAFDARSTASGSARSEPGAQE